MAVTQDIVQSNKEIVQAEFDSTWNEGNVTEDRYVDDFVCHGLASAPLDYDGLVADVDAFRTAFPDVHKEVEACIGEDDLVLVRYAATMTHQGDFAGVEPTGVSVDATGMVLCRVADGRIAEMWFNYDALGIMQQIGAVPAA